MLKHVQTYYEFLNEAISYQPGIKHKHVQKVINEIEQSLKDVLRLSEQDYAFVGSAGKRQNDDEIVYNINLGLDKTKVLKKNNLTEEEVYEFLTNQFKRLKLDIQVNNDKNELVTEWNVPESEDNKKIDLKIKLTDNLKWLKYSRHSPIEGKQSKYHSKYREAFLSAVSESIKKEITQFYNDKDLVKEFNEFTFDVEEGLFIITKSFEGKNGLLKKAIVLDETKRLVTDNPNDFSELLFGKGTKIKDTMTFERIMDLVESDSFPYKKKRKKIYEKLRNKLVGFKLKVPSEIKEK